MAVCCLLPMKLNYDNTDLDQYSIFLKISYDSVNSTALNRCQSITAFIEIAVQTLSLFTNMR